MLDYHSCYRKVEESSFTSSSKNSMSSSNDAQSHCTSFGRLSFELPIIPNHCPSPTTLKPHRSSDSSFPALQRRLKGNDAFGGLNFRDFSLVRQIGSGDIGRVYLCKLKGEGEGEGGKMYAMKVVDKVVLAMKKKVQRAETERKIMRMLNHPFLPTLFAEFEASQFCCVVMEYCENGDLHSLRNKQPHKRFPLTSARFYAAEVLVALEYLHMLGIIYRDLKPENVLVRSDGHIMLTDFDLSLCSDSIVAVESPDFPYELSFSSSNPTRSRTRPSYTPTPFSCISTRLFRSKKVQTLNNRVFIAEPVSARSCSFVGTHEYVAPEVASGRSHGNAVDWWALGIFIYEMIYGRTPFAGPSNEATLRNIIKKPLSFPTHSPINSVESNARDLISGLLKKDPGSRFGSKLGSAEVKTHPFFKGLNFALIRTVVPPGVPGMRRQKTAAFPHEKVRQLKSTESFDFF